jgi:osmotically-inducible protein OsmY
MKSRTSLIIALAAVALWAVSMPACASETDGRIETSFQNSYVYKSLLKDESIKINAEDGAVTLSGDVTDASHKSMAADIAEALPGVVSVDNQIQVVGDVPSANSDAWVGMKVKTALVFHRSVNAGKTEVDVKEGHLTLKGEAASQAQKDLTAEYAGDVEGVLSVNNEMTVAEAVDSEEPDQTMSEVIDDASITAQVKGALLMHRSTSALKTKVATDAGVVTVSGIAENEAERSLVDKLAEDIKGVKRVVNLMSIGGPAVLN